MEDSPGSQWAEVRDGHASRSMGGLGVRSLDALGGTRSAHDLAFPLDDLDDMAFGLGENCSYPCKDAVAAWCGHVRSAGDLDENVEPGCLAFKHFPLCDSSFHDQSSLPCTVWS